MKITIRKNAFKNAQHNKCHISSVLAAWNSFSSNLSCSSLFCASATHSSFRDNFLTCMHFSPHCVLPLHTCMYEFRYNQFYDKTPTFSVQRCLCVHFFGGDFPKHRPALLISLIRAFWYHQESRWSRSPPAVVPKFKTTICVRNDVHVMGYFLIHTVFLR